MSRDPYRSSAGDVSVGGRGGTRWDTERFAMERDRARFEERFEERDTRASRGGFGGRTRERSVDEIYERRGPRPEDDRYERRHYHDDEPRLEPERAFGRGRGQSITIEKERDQYYDEPSPPPRRAPPARPAFLRRQSSLDTFDRKPLTRYVERDIREDYGPPARYRDPLPPPTLTPIPLPRTRGLPPPRRYEKEYYDDIQVAEQDYYGEEAYRSYPEVVREREVIRKRRSSRDSRRSHSVRGSVRSSSVSSSSSEETVVSVKNEFPKKGKTRMPGKLVNKKAIADLGYPFEEDGEVVIILKALGRENIDEVIKLSEDYNKQESKNETVYEERTEVFTIPAPPPPPAPEPREEVRIVEERTVDFVPAPYHNHGPEIYDAGPREESTFIRRERDVIERSDPIPVGPLALAFPHERHRTKDERAIRAEIKALEAEKEALRAEKRAEKEMRKADRIRRGGGGRVSEGDLVLYEQDTYDSRSEEVTLVRRERIEEPEGGVRIEKDKKVPPPRLIRAMLKTLT